jgi:hypothetical protein
MCKKSHRFGSVVARAGRITLSRLWSVAAGCDRFSELWTVEVGADAATREVTEVASNIQSLRNCMFTSAQ